MVYLCKSYRDFGEVEHFVIFNNFEDAIKWCQKHARSVPSVKDGSDTIYYSAVYNVHNGIPFDPFNPWEPIKVFNSTCTK
jgi:hypothetical protein